MRIPMNVGEAREKRAVGILLAHAHLHGNVIFVAKRLKIGMFVKEAVENVAPGAPLAAYFDENVFAGFFRLPARSIQVFFRMATIPVAIRKKRSEEHTSELQSRLHLVCRLLLEKKKKRTSSHATSGSCSSWSYTNTSRITSGPCQSRLRVLSSRPGECRMSHEAAWDLRFSQLNV